MGRIRKELYAVGLLSATAFFAPLAFQTKKPYQETTQTEQTIPQYRPVSKLEAQTNTNNSYNKTKPYTGEQLLLTRTYTEGKPTMGTLYHDTNRNGKRDEGESKLCDTLEPAWNDNKAYQSCIPEGTYKMTPRGKTKKITQPHFSLHNVPGRTNVLIHSGNNNKNTKGCPLVGTRKGQYELTKSRTALKNLRQQFKGKKLRIHITKNDS